MQYSLSGCLITKLVHDYFTTFSWKRLFFSVRYQRFVENQRWLMYNFRLFSGLLLLDPLLLSTIFHRNWVKIRHTSFVYVTPSRWESTFQSWVLTLLKSIVLVYWIELDDYFTLWCKWSDCGWSSILSQYI